MSDLYGFIVENEGLAKALVRDHFKEVEITYAALFDVNKREAITDALDRI